MRISPGLEITRASDGWFGYGPFPEVLTGDQTALERLKALAAMNKGKNDHVDKDLSMRQILLVAHI